MSRGLGEVKESTHDFLNDRQWLSFISGFSPSTSIAYTIYRLLIVLTMVYMNVMAVCACVIEPSKAMIVNAVHFMLITSFITFWSVALRLLIFRSLEVTRGFLTSGVYCYEDEEGDLELMKMKQEMPSEIRWKSNIFVYMFILGGFTNTTIFPLSQFALLDGDLGAGVVNPYLPHLFYQPFDTRSPLGFVIGYLIGIAYYFFVYTISCAINWYYISGLVQMKIHFRVLNYSIRNIHKRAFQLYSKRWKTSAISQRELLNSAGFQECLYFSFRSNIQHHQALIRLMKMFELFTGSFALSVFSLSSLVYGCQLYLLYQVQPVNVTINLFLAFAAEQFTVIFICFLGEEVLVESEKVFEVLYDIDWFEYSNKFKQLLHIMMTNSIKPNGVKALLFGVPASLETYGQVVSAMYKVMNLVRQSDLV